MLQLTYTNALSHPAAVNPSMKSLAVKTAAVLVGAFTGALAGALTLGLDASLDVGYSFFGPTRNWWPIHAMVGALGGAVFGLGLGLFLVLVRVGNLVTLSVAGLIGGFGALVILLLNSGLSWSQRSLPAQVMPLLLSILIWPAIGLLIRRITRGRI